MTFSSLEPYKKQENNLQLKLSTKPIFIEETMSGECGYNRLPVLRGPLNLNSERVAEAAAATLGRLNSLMRQMNEWQEQRLTLESKVRSLKSALHEAGKDPDEVLKPDPLVVHQREEINRLKLAEDQLEEDVRGLRAALLEAEQAITCSGAKRLKDKLTKIREEAAEERRKLKDEIGYLRERVREAEEDSSCSAITRLRRKLREIFSSDKKIERIIADVASRSCATVIELSSELTRIKELLDQSTVENIKLRGERRRLKAAVESARGNELPPGSSEYLETIERLGFRVKELERKIKEFEDDSRLVKQVEELEEALNISRRQLDDRETLMMSLKNELLGAKTAYNLKIEELAGSEAAKLEVKALKEELEVRDKRVIDLEQQLTLANSATRDMEILRNELNRVKPELFNLEIERDGLLEDIEKMRRIVSDRNEHIVKILTENEERDKARRAEIEGAKTKLSVSLAERDKLTSAVKNTEKELARMSSKFSQMSEEASGDSAVLLKKIKELERAVVQLKRLSDPIKEDLTDANVEVKTLRDEVNILKGSKVKLQEELSDVLRRLDAVRGELAVEQSGKAAALEEAKSFKKENDRLGSERMKLDKIAVKFLDYMKKLDKKNAVLTSEIKELRAKNLELIVESNRLKINVKELTRVSRNSKIEFEEPVGESKSETGADNGDELTVNENVSGSKIFEENPKLGLSKKLWMRNRGLSQSQGEKLKTELDRSEAGNDMLERRLEIIEAEDDKSEEEINKLEKVSTEIEDNAGEVVKTVDNSKEKLRELEADNAASKAELQRVKVERDTLRDELRKLSATNSLLSNETENSRKQIIELTAIKEALNARLDLVQKQFDEALNEAESPKMKTALDKLKLENEALVKSLGEYENEKIELISTIERFRAASEEKSKIPCALQTPENQNPGRTLRVKGTLVMDCGDYVRADRELKYHIHLQSLAVKRVVDFISYVEGTSAPRPSMATFLEPTFTKLTILDFDDNVTATFRMSQKLSEKIFTAEVNVQRLEALRHEVDHLRAERDCLNNGMEKITAMLSVGCVNS